MRLILPKEYTNFFRIVCPIVLLLIAINNVFLNWKFQLYHFNELEDFGSILFVLIISIFESALCTFFLWFLLYRVIKKFVRNKVK